MARGPAGKLVATFVREALERSCEVYQRVDAEFTCTVENVFAAKYSKAVDCNNVSFKYKKIRDDRNRIEGLVPFNHHELEAVLNDSLFGCYSQMIKM